MDDHLYRFLCHKRTCGREFSSKAALNKHALTHMPPRYLRTTRGHRFKFQYQLKNHFNTHTDFQIKCRYPRCGRVYKSESEYNRHYKYIKLHIRSTHVPPVARSVQKKNLDEHMQIHTPTLHFACTKCGKEFCWQSSLSKHTLCKHPQHLPPFSSLRQVPKSRILKPKFLNCSDSWSYT